VDLLLGRRRGSRTTVASIQVKSSRTYSRPKTTDRTKRPFRVRVCSVNMLPSTACSRRQLVRSLIRGG
jgi:hypothetical protein